MSALHPQVEAVVRITNKANGQATFVRAPRSLTSRSTDFVNPRFKDFANGTLLLCTFNVSDKMRMLVKVSQVEAGVDWRSMPLKGDGNVTSTPPATKSAPLPPPPPVISAGWLGSVYFSREAQQLFDTAIKIAKTGQAINILMVGPSGYGKTTMPQAIAEKEGMKFLRVNCAAVRDPEEWFGYREAVDGSTKFVPTEFTTTVREGNAVIVLDEFNRIEPWLHNTLYPLLDDAKKTTVHGEEVRCGKNLIFACTINDGAQFTGTFALDAAIVNRMDAILPVKPLPNHIEVDLICKRTGLCDRETAKRLVDMMTKLRAHIESSGLEVDASTRSSLKIARLHQAGMSMRTAVEFAFLNALPRESAKSAIDIVSTFFV